MMQGKSYKDSSQIIKEIMWNYLEHVFNGGMFLTLAWSDLTN